MNSWVSFANSVVPWLDCLSLLFTLPIIIVMWHGRHIKLCKHLKFAVAAIAVTLLFHNTSNVLESLGITDALDAYEDYFGMLHPVIFFFAVFIYAQELGHDQLRESEERFRALFESARDGILLAEMDTFHFVMSNPAICEMLGYTKEEIKMLSIPDIHRPEDQKWVRETVKKQLEGLFSLSPEIPIKRKDGTIFYADINGVPVELAGKQYLLGQFRDATERMQTEEELRKVHKLESIGTLAGGIAHDFNNILQGLFGNLELAKMQLPKNHEASIFLTTAFKALERARRLTAQLLTFSKGGSPVLGVVNLKEVIQNSIAFSLIGSKIKAHTDLSEDLWYIKADKSQINQVISSLAINAMEAMPDGGNLYIDAENIEDSREKVAPQLSGDFVRLTIRDEGSGISNEIREKVFDPYFGTKKTGNGLGLAIAHSIVDKHSGHISFNSKPNEGTTFTILLPAETSAQPEEASPERTKTKEFQPGHILVMDDEQLVRDALKRMLESRGCTVDTVIDGKEALTQYAAAKEEGKPFDAIVMDLTIPGGMGGKEAAEQLLTTDPDAKILVASGYSNDPVMANYSDYGFKGRLTKPFQIADITNELCRILD